MKEIRQLHDERQRLARHIAFCATLDTPSGETSFLSFALTRNAHDEYQRRRARLSDLFMAKE
jgi:hypothetical protein